MQLEEKGTFLSGTNSKSAVQNQPELTSDAISGADAQHVRMFAERSVEAAYKLIEDSVDLGSRMERGNALAVIANDVSVIAEKELTVYSPVLCDWYPESAMVAPKLLHQLYGERLVGKFSRPIILEWVIAQHARILEWTGHALDLEEWEPLSYQQKYSSSSVEVFRIIEETVDQFFGLSLPLDVTHLQALLSIIFHTLDSFLHKVCNDLVDKHHLYLPVPPLTRYKEAVFPVIKKKVVENVLLEEEVNSNLVELAVSKLCIRLNTLQ